MWISQQNEDSQRTESNQQKTQSGSKKTDNRLKLRFPKTARLLTSMHYRHVLQSKNKLLGSCITIDFRLGRSPCPKLGVTASKRCGKAHDRNRFKRVSREAFRLLAPRFPEAVEINVSPCCPLQKIDRAAIEKDLEKFLDHLKK